MNKIVNDNNAINLLKISAQQKNTNFANEKVKTRLMLTANKYSDIRIFDLYQFFEEI
jgi:hypothetical protein